MSESELEIYTTIFEKYSEDTRIEQFKINFYLAGCQISEFKSKIRDSLSQNDYNSLKKIVYDLKNLDEIDLLIFSSVELSELDDEELSCYLRNLVVSLENERDSLILNITAICPDLSGVPLPICNEDAAFQDSSDVPLIEDRITEVVCPSDDELECSLTTISELSEENVEEQSNNCGWSSEKLKNHIFKLISKLPSVPMDRMVDIFEEYEKEPEFRMVNELIESFMQISVSEIANEVIKRAELSNDFIYIRKSQILKLMLILCAINCKFHGFDLNSNELSHKDLNKDGLSDVIELMHYELCISTSLIDMFQLIVRIEETQLSDYKLCNSVMETLVYNEDMSHLSMTILLLHRLYYYNKTKPNISKVGLLNCHLGYETMLGLFTCLIIYILSNLKLETFGLRPQ